jgi:hypothetical protein
MKIENKTTATMIVITNNKTTATMTVITNNNNTTSNISELWCFLDEFFPI